MSLRSRPTDLTDRFESESKGTYDQKPNLGSVPFESISRAHTLNINVFQALEVLSVLLKDYQSKHFHIEGTDPFHQLFPFAWNALQVGDEIKNLNTNEIYRVEELIKTRDHDLDNYVRLKGSVPPKNWEILRLDDKRTNLVNVVPAYPDTEVKPYEFTEAGHIQDVPGAPTWNDAITYSVVKEAPGSRDRGMFQGNQELTPRYRETVDNVEIMNQLIDTELRFDFWTLSNKTSELMREWFRDFAIKYRWLMKYNGLSQFHWILSYTANKATSWRPGIVHRSASFYFRTEYSTSELLYTIKGIDVKVMIPTSNNEDSEQININI